MTAGSYAVAVTSGGVTAGTFTETNLAGTASQVVVSSGGGQSTTVGTTFPTLLSGIVEDAHGNPVLVAGVSVTFTAPGAGATGTFANGTDTTTVVTIASGVATANRMPARLPRRCSGSAAPV
jgi:hypothetical protein